MISYEAMIRRDVLIAYLAVPISDATLVLRRTHSHTHAHTHNYTQPHKHTHTHARTTIPTHTHPDTHTAFQRIKRCHRQPR